MRAMYTYIHCTCPIDKVEMKDQNMQTETVESQDQQVQAETRAQEQGMLQLGVKTIYGCFC